MGRSFKNTLFNLDLTDNFTKALSKYKVKIDKLYELEPDAGLGNGGLGRLAACFLDSLSSCGYPAMGYCIRYEYGIFRQKIVEGWQTEMPDFWLPGGSVWLEPRPASAVDVFFDGKVKEAAGEQLRMLNLINALFSEVNPIPVKAAMAAMGYCEDSLRLPLTPMEDALCIVMQ